MKKKLTLLDRARADLMAISALLNDHLGDEAILDVCAFHCQQCIEKCLKYLCATNGVEFSAPHDLYYLLEDLNMAPVNEKISPILGTINLWVAVPRHGTYIVSTRKSVATVKEVCEWLVAYCEENSPPIVRA